MASPTKSAISSPANSNCDGTLDIDDQNVARTRFHFPSSRAESMTAPPRSRRRYSIAELEALRLSDLENQKQWWKDVFNGLSPSVVCEYEGIQSQRCGGGGGRKKNKKRDKKTNEKQHGEPSSEQLVEETVPSTGEKGAGKQLLEETSTLSDVKVLQEATTTGVCIQLVEETANMNPCNVTSGDDYIGASNAIAEEVEPQYEDEYDDGDSDEERESIQHPAFVVEGEPDFESGPPLDGLEYLRRVRWEASQIPKVKVAKIDSSKIISEQTPYMPKIPRIPECPFNLLPSKEWEDDFLAEFSVIRKAFSELANSLDQSVGDRIKAACDISNSVLLLNTVSTMTASLSMDAKSRIATNIPNFGQLRNNSPEKIASLAIDDTTGPTHKKFNLGSCPKNPTMTASLGIDSTGRSNRKISKMDHWPKASPTMTALLDMDPTTRAATLCSFIDLFENSNSLSRDQALWLYALCVAVDTPLLAETSASIRCLLRKCSTLLVDKSEHDDEVVMLNILVTICGKYFGQSEK